nr:uncharacterized protein LOC113829167 [Penaeus vannamei]
MGVLRWRTSARRSLGPGIRRYRVYLREVVCLSGIKDLVFYPNVLAVCTVLPKYLLVGVRRTKTYGAKNQLQPSPHLATGAPPGRSRFTYPVGMAVKSHLNLLTLLMSWTLLAAVFATTRNFYKRHENSRVYGTIVTTLKGASVIRCSAACEVVAASCRAFNYHRSTDTCTLYSASRASRGFSL